MIGTGLRRGLGVLGMILLAGLVPAGALACGFPPKRPPPAPVYDPYEGFNRAVFGLNQQLYAALGAALPSMTLPAGVSQDIHGVFRTLRDPVGAAAGLVTGDLDTAWNATARFAINATAGAFGTREVASGLGYPPGPTDLGSELCRTGLLADPSYLVLPLIGPTNFADLGGQIATNIGLRLLIGPYYLPYYVLDRIDRYMQRPAPPSGAAPADPYAAQRAAALALRARRCGSAR
jgi:phospholipid-binding lipoprotein MlaA